MAEKSKLSFKTGARGIALLFAIVAAPVQAINNSAWHMSPANPSGPVGSSMASAFRSSSAEPRTPADRAKKDADIKAFAGAMENKSMDDAKIHALNNTLTYYHTSDFLQYALPCRSKMMAEAPDKPLNFAEIKACAQDTRPLPGVLYLLYGLIAVIGLTSGGAGYAIWNSERELRAREKEWKRAPVKHIPSAGGP